MVFSNTRNIHDYDFLPLSSKTRQFISSFQLLLLEPKIFLIQIQLWIYPSKAIALHYRMSQRVYISPLLRHQKRTNMHVTSRILDQFTIRDHGWNGNDLLYRLIPSRTKLRQSTQDGKGAILVPISTWPGPDTGPAQGPGRLTPSSLKHWLTET